MTLLPGHSFYMLRGFAFPFRTAGLVYQLGGLLALWPGLFGKSSPLIVFAVATALGNLWIGIGVGWQSRLP